MSGPVSQTSASVGQDREGTGSSMIEEASSLARISERDKLKAASVEDQSGIGEVFSMPSKMSDLYGSTGKLLPINSERQHELIPTAEEDVDVRANIIFLDRDYSEESSLPTVPPPSSLTQRGNSRPEGHNNTETVDPK
ncbi:hypothetical protein MKW94_018121, partial [Papaver nudicaule]|nr:hypothetical protein [Papaver nudicaule]